MKSPMYQIIISLRKFTTKRVRAESVKPTTENDILRGINNNDDIIAVSFVPRVEWSHAGHSGRAV
jgi:hypothetical protein